MKKNTSNINRMKNNKVKSNAENNKRISNESFSKKDRDLEECDKLLEELDCMEENNSKLMSSKVKNVIKSDKKDISERNKKINHYDMLNSTEEINTNSNDNYLNEDFLQDELPEEDILEDRILSEEVTKAEHTEDIKDKTLKEEIISEELEDEEKEKEDFLANLNKKSKEINLVGLRKKQPRRLNDKDSDVSYFRESEDYSISGFFNNKKYFYIGTAIATLLIVLFAALVLDRNPKETTDTKFLDIDKAPIIELFTNYYKALSESNIEGVKNSLENVNGISDQDIIEKCQESVAYSKSISDSYKITDCYLQKGLKKNEYIAYIKFELKFKSVETPAVGLFTTYVVNVSKDKAKTDYKIYNEISDKTSARYKYISSMKNAKNVLDIVKKVEEELVAACKKDAGLKKLVDTLQNPENTNESTN